MVIFLRNCGVSWRYTSLLAVAVGILLFLLTSFSDPGTVKAENVSQYIAAYPYDNIIYSEKGCPTCKLPKLVFFFSLCLRTSLNYFLIGNRLMIFFPFVFCVLDRLGPSIAAYVVAVLLGLTIIVDGWYEIIYGCLLGFMIWFLLSSLYWEVIIIAE